MLDIAPFLNSWVYPLCALLLAGSTAWLLAKSSGWLDAHASFLDASARTKILAIEKEAIDEGVNVVMSEIEKTGAKIQPNIDNPIVRWGAQIAINHAAGTLADNGADPDEVAAKILTRLPPAFVSTDTTGATIQPLSPVQTSPLKPIGV